MALDPGFPLDNPLDVSHGQPGRNSDSPAQLLEDADHNPWPSTTPPHRKLRRRLPLTPIEVPGSSEAHGCPSTSLSLSGSYYSDPFTIDTPGPVAPFPTVLVPEDQTVGLPDWPARPLRHPRRQMFTFVLRRRPPSPIPPLWTS
eukprot:EG_transcript_14664